MRNTVDKGIDNSRGFFGKAQERARDLSERGILRFEIMQLESRVEKLTAQLGARAYEALSKEGKNTISRNTPGVKDIISEIEDIEKRVHEKEADLAVLAQRSPDQGGEDGSEAAEAKADAGNAENVRKVGPDAEDSTNPQSDEKS
ncbi:MAG: hypothetical protein GVY29_08680 [Spirochaetes bacterium]|nr:hypothetical protein [Spirochaetota bacterium]